jgi:uncharacterized protein involved in exopolysaccharide biosynthesis
VIGKANFMKQTPSMQETARLGEAGSSQETSAPISAFGNQVEQPFLHLDFKRSLQMHGRLAAGIACLGLLAAIVYTGMKWPVYTAESQLFVQPAAPQLLDQSRVTGWPSDSNAYDTFIQQKIQSASNPTVLLNALHKLPAGAWPLRDGDEQAAALRLEKAFTVKREGTSYQITITAQAHRSALAAQIANAVAAAVVDNSAEEARIGNKERIAALQAERDRVQKSLDSDRTEQDAINAKLGIAAIGPLTPDHYDEDITHLHEELIRARADRETAAARLNTVHSSSSQALDAEADEQIVADPGLVGLKTALNQRRAVLMAQMANLTPSHPQYKQDADELAHIDSSLESATKELRAKTGERLQQRLRTDLNRTTEVEERLNAQLARVRGSAIGATPEMQRASDLASDILRLQGRYSEVDGHLHNLMLETNIPGAAYLAAAAATPAHPAYMVVLRIAVPLAIGGILLGLLAALLIQNLDPRIYIGSDIERLLGCPPMVQLSDFDQISEKAVDEQLFRLAALLKHAYQQKSIRNCLIIPCAPGDGATTIAQGVKKLLGQLGQPASFTCSGGMLAASMNRKHSESGNADGLSAMPSPDSEAAKIPDFALRAGANGEQKASETLCITDAAPLAISAETEYLTRYADAAIVIVQSGVTTDVQLRDTARSLQRLGVPTMGFVLNRIRTQHADSHFRQSTHLLETNLRRRHSTAAKKEDTLPVRVAEAPAPVSITAATELNRKEPEPQQKHTPLPPQQEKVSLPSPLPSPAEEEIPVSAIPVNRKSQEDAARNETASPLSRLRKIVSDTQLGELRQHRQTEPPGNSTVPPLKQTPTPRQTADARTSAQAAPEHISVVVPVPEYLPPSSEAEEEADEAPQPGTHPHRPSKRNVRILPSQPGQYD